MDKLLEVLNKVKADVDFEVEKQLIDDGILDSVDTLSIVAELESAFNIELSPMDLTSENFNNIEAMQKLIERLVK